MNCFFVHFAFEPCDNLIRGHLGACVYDDSVMRPFIFRQFKGRTVQRIIAVQQCSAVQQLVLIIAGVSWYAVEIKPNIGAF